MTTATTAPVKETKKVTPQGETAKPELSNFVLPAPTPKLSIEQRLKIFNKLSNLHEQRDRLKEALDQINKFQISPTGGGEIVKLSDNKGQVLTFAHPIVIGEMIATAKAKFEQLLKEVEEQFDF